MSISIHNGSHFCLEHESKPGPAKKGFYRICRKTRGEEIHNEMADFESGEFFFYPVQKKTLRRQSPVFHHFLDAGRKEGVIRV